MSKPKVRDLAAELRDSLARRRRASDRRAEALFTRRRWLTCQAMLAGANIWLAVEAVATTAIEHPEWDMDEERTWAEWMER